MVTPISIGTLSQSTLFKKGDFNKITGLYTMMLSKGIARDCTPLTDAGMLSFLIYKSSKDPIWLYNFKIERDLKNQRFVYEVTDFQGNQIARDSKIEPVIKKFKYHIGEKHNINEWKASKRATERVD